MNLTEPSWNLIEPTKPSRNLLQNLLQNTPRPSSTVSGTLLNLPWLWTFSGTFSTTYFGSLLNLTRHLHQCTFWTEDPIRLRCSRKIQTVLSH
jgi:hypothetical protein